MNDELDDNMIDRLLNQNAPSIVIILFKTDCGTSNIRFKVWDIVSELVIIVF